MCLKFDYADMSQVAKEVIFVKKKFPDFDYIRTTTKKNSCQKLLLQRNKKFNPRYYFSFVFFKYILKIRIKKKDNPKNVI